MEDEVVKAAADWWARGLGIAALTASLGALAWNMYNAVLRDRAKLSITTALSVLGFAGTTTRTCVSVDVSNSGRRPITITHFTFGVGAGKNLTYVRGLALKDPILGAHVDTSHELPKRLEEGELHRFYFPVETIRDAIRDDPLIELERVIITDGTGRSWRRRVPKYVRNYFKTDAKAANDPVPSTPEDVNG